METLYQYATRIMGESIKVYLELTEQTKDFTEFTSEILSQPINRQMIMCGKSLSDSTEDSKKCIQELSRVPAIKFDIEKGITAYVYDEARTYIDKLIGGAEELSNNFTSLSEDDVKEHPYYLPIWQAALNISSKSNLKAIFGSVTDQNISKPSAKKICDYANSYFGDHNINKVRIKERTERTLEGIVRDLIGRLVYEAIVEKALNDEKVPFLKEEQYSGIEGVVYKFRADFVIPNEENPKAFIEVRKSSSRHASLYAKDKMFSAINWKGKYQDMLGIVIAEGEWTNESLLTMSKVFDYVIPVSKSRELAKNINKYLEGDKSILKWIIDFKINVNDPSDDNN